MIHFNLNDKKFNSDIKSFISVMSEIDSRDNIKMINSAIGSIAADSAIKNLNREARSNKKQYHHLYEWNETGKDIARLVKIKKTVNETSVNLNFVFKKSKTRVPVAKKLLTPGKTGKFVTRRSVFRDKARVIESGTPVKWKAKRNVVFLNGSSLVFKGRGKVFTISNPGGRAAHGALDRFSKKWERGMATSAINKSKIFPRIEKDVAKTLSLPKPSKSEIKSCIKMVCAQYNYRQQEF